MCWTNLGTLACCPKQGLLSSFPTAYLKPLPLCQLVVSQGDINSPLRFQSVVAYSGKGEVESSRPDHSLRAAGLPRSGSSVVSCPPEQTTSLSTSGLEAESERNVKAEVVLLVGQVGNRLCMMQGPFGGPPNAHIPFPTSDPSSAWPETLSPADPL